MGDLTRKPPGYIRYPGRCKCNFDCISIHEFACLFYLVYLLLFFFDVSVSQMKKKMLWPLSISLLQNALSLSHTQPAMHTFQIFRWLHYRRHRIFLIDIVSFFTPQRVCTLPSLDKFRNCRADPQQCCTKNYVLANNSVANVSVTLWFCLQRSCKKCLVPCDSAGSNAVVKLSVLSVFIDLRCADCMYCLC